jgi:3-deoxy-7-phosphoheptulonate synthase
VFTRDSACNLCLLIALLYLFSRQRLQTHLGVSVTPDKTSISTSSSGDWSPSSWRTKNVAQAPNYESEEELEAAVFTLKRFSPLVFAGEVRSLHEQLARACSGQGFLLMGGDCAEAFNEFNVDHVRDTFRVILQMSLVLTFGSAMPIIKVGRMAGQFAKPRSEPDEVIDGVSLPSYRGDIINTEAFTKEARRHNPQNMVAAYHQSAQTLNILRAFSTGGYADISRLHAWNLDFVEQTDEGSRYVRVDS